MRWQLKKKLYGISLHYSWECRFLLDPQINLTSSTAKMNDRYISLESPQFSCVCWISKGELVGLCRFLTNFFYQRAISVTGEFSSVVLFHQNANIWLLVMLLPIRGCFKIMIQHSIEDLVIINYASDFVIIFKCYSETKSNNILTGLWIYVNVIYTHYKQL